VLESLGLARLWLSLDSAWGKAGPLKRVFIGAIGILAVAVACRPFQKEILWAFGQPVRAWEGLLGLAVLMGFPRLRTRRHPADVPGQQEIGAGGIWFGTLKGRRLPFCPGCKADKQNWAPLVETSSVGESVAYKCPVCQNAFALSRSELDDAGVLPKARLSESKGQGRPLPDLTPDEQKVLDLIWEHGSREYEGIVFVSEGLLLMHIEKRPLENLRLSLSDRGLIDYTTSWPEQGARSWSLSGPAIGIMLARWRKSGS
jgi:hypothetical protein